MKPVENSLFFWATLTGLRGIQDIALNKKTGK